MNQLQQYADKVPIIKTEEKKKAAGCLECCVASYAACICKTEGKGN